MLNTIDFVSCIRDNLKDRRFGEKRIAEILSQFNARAEYHKSVGADPTRANSMAMADVFDRMSLETVEAAKRNAKMISVQAETMARAKAAATVDTSAFLMDGKKGSRGTALARAVVAAIEHDARFGSRNYIATRAALRGQLYAVFNDVLEKVGKGVFGTQKGKAHLPNIIREVFGQDTADQTAKEFAQAWLKVSDLGVDLFNNAGGSMRRLTRYLPQMQNPVKLVKAGEGKWVSDHLKDGVLDWANMRWPDGTIIAKADREGILREAYKTLSTDGATKIDPTKFRGRGRAVGNQLGQHRFLHYKTPEAWLSIHEQYGDGNVFEVFTRHIEDMAHRIALVDVFGPNPEAAAQNMKAVAKKAAANLSAKDAADADAVLKNKFDPMFEAITRQNPMDPHSGLGALTTGTSELLVAAQLGSASFLAIPGDFMQTAAVRALNGMGLFDGMRYYFGALATDSKFARQISTQSGFVMDEVVEATYATTRFTGLATQAPAVTRRISDVVMRASLLAGHTRSARWASQAEFMGLLARSRSTAYSELPFKPILQRYRITEQEWDLLRTRVSPHSPKQGVEFLRPIDILKSDMANKQAAYQKWQSMIYDASREMVPDSTIEASVMLRGTSRPDTLVGAILHSFSMYKNFPVSFMMIYGRLGATAPGLKGKLVFYAGLGAAMTMVGALGTQMREISKGREPLPMDNLAFLGKSFLSGGAMSIWGDFLFTGVNEYGRGPQDVVGGPLVGLLGDTTDLLLGDVFKWADTVGSLDSTEFKSSTGAKAVEWAKRYVPGTSIWWARLALERAVFDRLSEIADPDAYKKRRRNMQRQEREFGNGYWAPPKT